MKDEFIAAVAIDVSVYAGYQTLTTCFFVSGDAIDLTGKNRFFISFVSKLVCFNCVGSKSRIRWRIPDGKAVLFRAFTL